MKGDCLFCRVSHPCKLWHNPPVGLSECTDQEQLLRYGEKDKILCALYKNEDSVTAVVYLALKHLFPVCSICVLCIRQPERNKREIPNRGNVEWHSRNLQLHAEWWRDFRCFQTVSTTKDLPSASRGIEAFGACWHFSDAWLSYKTRLLETKRADTEKTMCLWEVFAAALQLICNI